MSRRAIFASAPSNGLASAPTTETPQGRAVLDGPENDTIGVARLDLWPRMSLAWLYQETGRYKEAEPLYQRAVAIMEKVLGPEHPELPNWLGNLALFYRDTDRDADAEPLFQRALAITEKAHGPEHVDLANWLGHVITIRGDSYRRADEWGWGAATDRRRRS